MVELDLINLVMIDLTSFKDRTCLSSYSSLWSI